MTRFVAARLAGLLFVLLGVTVLTFALGALAPGDPAEMVLERTRPGEPVTGEQLDRLRAELGLDRPLAAQYLRWLSRALRGDLGESWVSGTGVAQAMGERLPRTVALALSSLGLSLLVAVPLGLAAAHRKDGLLDRLSRVAAMLGTSLPAYLVAYVLILVFAVELGVLPAFGFGSPADLVLPALTLAIGPAATLTRFTRAAVLDVLGEEHVRAARAKGLRPGPLLVRHALRNASVPLVTVVGLSLGGLLGGAFVVEWIFAWPGVGTLAVDAINDKDYPVIQGFVLLTATGYVVVNFLTDVAYAALDPRIRLSSGRP